MMNVLDVFIFLASMGLGASLMRWADIRVEQAVKAERLNFQRILREREQEFPVATTTDGFSVNDAGYAPLPLMFGDAEEAELRKNGAFVRQKRTGKAVV